MPSIATELTNLFQLNESFATGAIPLSQFAAVLQLAPALPPQMSLVALVVPAAIKQADITVQSLSNCTRRLFLLDIVWLFVWLRFMGGLFG